jgi:DNA primase large subunit
LAIDIRSYFEWKLITDALNRGKMELDTPDLITILRSYIESVLSNVHDMKILLFDSETAQMARF